MGEYARVKGSGAEIKIGTCEQMYYLRADQIGAVWAQPGNVDPDRDRFDGIRFRFPFPDEDATAPGDFAEHDRAFRVEGVAQPAGVEHYSVQFSARNGYLVSLPCPESLADFKLADGTPVHRNGYGGSWGIHSQRFLREDADGPERLVTVARCLGCGALWRLHTWADAQPVVVALRAQADEYERREAAELPAYGATPRTLHAIAERIAAGYGIAEGVTK